jgi:TPR repeat protein
MDETAADSLYESAVAQMRLPRPDNAHIVRMLRRAIDAGSPRAAYALATWYLHGKDDVVALDYTEAVKLLRIAAEVHLPSALYDLAACYANGEGVDKDPQKAFELYLRAALHGDDDAVFKVGRAYYYGFGVAEDRRVAGIWLDRAEELGTFEPESRTDADN